MPSIGALNTEGNKVNAEYSSELPVKGYLLYTCDKRIWMERKWIQVEVPIDGKKVSSELPFGVTSFFLAVEDTRNAYVSTLPIT